MTEMQKHEPVKEENEILLRNKQHQNIFVQKPSSLSYLVLNSHGPYKYVAVCLEDKPGCVLSKAVLE